MTINRTRTAAALMSALLIATSPGHARSMSLQCSSKAQCAAIDNLYAELDDLCRGGAGDATDQACVAREKLGKILPKSSYYLKKCGFHYC